MTISVDGSRWGGTITAVDPAVTQVPKPDLAQRLRAFRAGLGLPRAKAAVCFGVSEAALITWEDGRRRPRRDAEQRVEAALARFEGTPKRQLGFRHLPFAKERIPIHCGVPAKQFAKAEYSRARVRRKWIYRFLCRKCGKMLVRDKLGREVPPIPSGNWVELPFERPKCCRRPLTIWRRAKRHRLFEGQTIYFLWCRQPFCPHKGTKRAFLEQGGQAEEVTEEYRREWRKHRGIVPEKVGERPLCKACRHPCAIFDRRKIGGELQIRFGCSRHRAGSNRWFHQENQKWVPLVPYKHGPRGAHNLPTRLPPELGWSQRHRCHGKPMRLHEFPPNTRGGYRYRLRCSECARSRWLDASLAPLPPRKPGRPPGPQKRRPRTIRRKADLVVRERNRLIFRGKSKGRNTDTICEVLDLQKMPLPHNWSKNYTTWGDVFQRKARLPIRLFSVTFARLQKMTERERQFYLAGA